MDDQYFFCPQPGCRAHRLDPPAWRWYYRHGYHWGVHPGYYYRSYPRYYRSYGCYGYPYYGHYYRPYSGFHYYGPRVGFSIRF